MNEKKNCPICRTKRSYCGKHDSYYCEKCDIWLEKSCTDEMCDFCVKRPTVPSAVLSHAGRWTRLSLLEEEIVSKPERKPRRRGKK